MRRVGATRLLRDGAVVRFVRTRPTTNQSLYGHPKRHGHVRDKVLSEVCPWPAKTLKDLAERPSLPTYVRHGTLKELE